MLLELHTKQSLTVYCLDGISLLTRRRVQRDTIMERTCFIRATLASLSQTIVATLPLGA